MMGFLDGKPKDWPQTRGQRFFQQRGVWPTMPAVNPGEMLVDALNDAGVCSRVGNEIRPLSWSEIHAYKECTGVISSVWECRMLREMSRAYITGLTVGNDVFGIPPEEESSW